MQCDFSFNESYTRVGAHLLQLKGEGVRIEFKKLDNETTLKIEISKKRKVPLPVSNKGNQTNKGFKLKGPLESSFNI